MVPSTLDLLLKELSSFVLNQVTLAIVEIAQAVYSARVKHCFTRPAMLKTITKIGNSQGLIFDTALCELSGLKAGDQVNVTIHPGGSLIITPIISLPPAKEVTALIDKTVKDYRKTLRKLS